MGKWPLWIGTTLLAVAVLQLAMIFVLPSLPIGVASESARASNGNVPGGEKIAAGSIKTEAAPRADLPLYTACVHETSKRPTHLAAGTPNAGPGERHSDVQRFDILFVFSGNARSASDQIVMHAPAQFGIVMHRNFVAYGRETEKDDGARQAADCTPF